MSRRRDFRVDVLSFKSKFRTVLTSSTEELPKTPACENLRLRTPESMEYIVLDFLDSLIRKEQKTCFPVRGHYGKTCHRNNSNFFDAGAIMELWTAKAIELNPSSWIKSQKWYSLANKFEIARNGWKRGFRIHALHVHAQTTFTKISGHFKFFSRWI